MSEVTKTDRLLDLFCGVGNLTLPLAREAARVKGIEIDKQAIDFAKENAILAGLENVEFESADALKWVKNKGSKSLASPLYDVVVLDPPRGGCADMLGALTKLAPRRIIYVSCSPPTLARDISSLRESGYVPKRAVMLDMFPQTYHIESVVVLDKED